MLKSYKFAGQRYYVAVDESGVNANQITFKGRTLKHEVVKVEQQKTVIDSIPRIQQRCNINMRFNVLSYATS